jgi:hypothetical protein
MKPVQVAGALLAALIITSYPYPKALAASDGVQIDGVTVTAQDLHQLFAALHSAMQPNDMTVPILVSLKKTAEMPSYDQQYHYAGIGQDAKGARVLHVWINSDLNATDQENAIAAGFMLAITDGGYAGTAFKSLYDVFAKKDAQLSANAPDPFLNRHRFAAALVHQLNLTPH